MEAKTETPTDPKRSYLCFTCEVSTPPMTETEAAAERASGHDLQPNGPSLLVPVLGSKSSPIAARWYGVELRGPRYAGVCVLAKNDPKYGLRALTFANVKQAEAARDRYENASGRAGFVIGRRPYYVRIGGAS